MADCAPLICNDFSEERARAGTGRCTSGSVTVTGRWGEHARGPELLDAADDFLGAGGLLKIAKEDGPAREARMQLRHLHRLGNLRSMELQVMPTTQDEHAALGGPFTLLTPKGRQPVAYFEVQNVSRLITDPEESVSSPHGTGSSELKLSRPCVLGSGRRPAPRGAWPAVRGCGPRRPAGGAAARDRGGPTSPDWWAVRVHEDLRPLADRRGPEHGRPGRAVLDTHGAAAARAAAHISAGCARIAHMGEQSWAEIGERVAEARLVAGFSQGELATRLELDRTAVVRMEAGDRRINALELYRLAEALRVPVAHFLSRPPAALVSRRSSLEENADEASRARYRLDTRLEEHARNAQWLMSHRFLTPSPLSIGMTRGHDATDPVRMARTARQCMGAPQGPLGALADVLEQLNLFVTVVDEPAEGASLLLDGYGVAVISGQAAPGRRRWTAVHELGHHLMQDEYHTDAGIAASRDEREQVIDRFTEEFLLPEVDLREAWQRVERGESDRTVLIDVAASYRVSWGAAVSRARNTSLIDAVDARRLRANTPVRGDFLAVQGSEPMPDLEVGTTGPRWRRAVLSAWSQGTITATRTVELLYGAVSEQDLPSRDPEDYLP